MEPVEINAGRLHLRPWAPYDAEAVFVACSDLQTQRWTTVPVPYTRRHAQSYVDGATAGWTAETALTWAVRDSTTGDVLASIALTRAEGPEGGHGDSDAAEGRWSVGYWAVPVARGHGVVTEAVQAVCRWAFGPLGAQRISWTAEVGNWPSRRVAERAGFAIAPQPTGTLTHRGAAVPAWWGVRLPTDPPGDTGHPVERLGSADLE